MRPAQLRQHSVHRQQISQLVLSFLVLCSVILVACSGATTKNAPSPVSSTLPNTTFPLPPIRSLLELGWVVPKPSDATGNELDVQRLKIGDYQGKVLVLDFYATWCVPCRQSIPHLDRLQREYRESGLEIIGLNVGGADDRVKVKEFAKELNIQYSLGFPDQELTNVLLSGDSSIPQTFVFSRDGLLVKRFIGYEESTGLMLDQVIQNEINNRP